MIKRKKARLARAMLEQGSTTPTSRRTPSAPRMARPVARNHIDIIDEAVRLKRADPDQALVWKVQAVFQPSKLPRALRAPDPIAKCTTPQLRRVVYELKERYPTLSRKAKNEISKYIRLHKHGRTYKVEYRGP